MKWNVLLAALLVAPLTALAEDPPGPDWVPGLLAPEEAAEGFYPLFNGKDLDGWWIRGKNKEAFAARDGMLVLTGTGGGDWIFTDREYENFILRIEYRLPPEGGNSGIGIRARSRGNPAFTGMEVQVYTPGKGEPYQYAGALYSTVAPEVQADNPAGEWNALEIMCDGPRIRTVMNGKQLYDIKTTDYTEEKDWQKPLTNRVKRGHIALQDHGDGGIAYRNIRIKPLPGGEGWRPLLNGKDLTGWKVVGDAQWSVLEGGVLRVNGEGMTGRSELRTLEEFGDFEMSLSIRPHKKEGGSGANSGVFFRGTGDAPWPRTYEAQCDNHDPRQFTGAIWDQVPASELRAMDECWFHMHIIADGPHIQVAINGKTVVDYMSKKHKKCPRGWISLQGHDPKSIVDFKDIEIKPIESKEGS
jgi:hypothetical protein